MNQQVVDSTSDRLSAYLFKSKSMDKKIAKLKGILAKDLKYANNMIETFKQISNKEDLQRSAFFRMLPEFYRIREMSKVLMFNNNASIGGKISYKENLEELLSELQKFIKSFKEIQK